MNYPTSVAENTTSPAETEADTLRLDVIDGHATASSLDIAEHFGKLHKDVLRAIRDLECSESFYERNFAPIQNDVDLGLGRTRQDPAYRITRDGFTFLAMGFTGKEAARWKEAYIDAFNAMEAKLRALYVEPLLDASDKQFRKGIPLRFKLTLQEQGRRAMNNLLNETRLPAKRNLYWQLRQINDALGIPTESMEALIGVVMPAIEHETA